MRFSHVKRAIAAVVGGAVLVSLSLTGCSGQTGSGTGGSATKGSINWWSWTPDNDVAAREIAEFNKQYPGIKVTYKKVPIDNYAAVLRPALASNDGPDVYTVNASGAFSGQTFAPYAYDLTASMKKLLGANWKSKVYSGGTEAWTVKGRLVASEFAKVGAGILWINKDIFDKYHLTPPTTLEEWKKVCDTFRANGLGCFREGLSGTAGFVLDTIHSIADSVKPGVWADALAGKKKWNDPTIVQALKIFGELQSDGILDEGSVGIQQYPDVNNAFLSGKVPMVQMGTWYSQYATDNSLTAALQGAGVPADTKKITIVPIPFPDVAGKGNPSTLFADPDAGQSVNAKSKHLNAAVTFALWLGATKEGAQVVANNVDSFPTLEGVGPQLDKITLVNQEVQQPELEKLTKALSATSLPRSNGMTAQVSQALIDASQAMANGSKSPQDAADAVAAAAAGS